MNYGVPEELTWDDEVVCDRCHFTVAIRYLSAHLRHHEWQQAQQREEARRVVAVGRVCNRCGDAYAAPHQCRATPAQMAEAVDILFRTGAWQ